MPRLAIKPKTIELSDPPALRPKDSATVMAALIGVQLLFGIHHVVAKVLVTHIPPIVWASFRALTTAVIMAFLCVVLGKPHPKMNFNFFGPVILFCFLAIILNQTFFLVGLSMTTSGNAAILSTLIPVFTVLFVTLKGQEVLSPARTMGFVSAFIGVLVLCRVEILSISDSTFTGDILILLNCICFSLYLSFGKKFLEKYDPFWTTTWLFIFGSVGLTLIAIPAWSTFSMPTATPLLVGSAIYAIVGGTVATYFLNNYALAKTDASKVALFVYIQPVVTGILGYMLLEEAFQLRNIVATVFIFVGIYFSVAQTTSRV